jgi:hypothetical protein
VHHPPQGTGLKGAAVCAHSRRLLRSNTPPPGGPPCAPPTKPFRGLGWWLRHAGLRSGRARCAGHEGERPMAIRWRLERWGAWWPQPQPCLQRLLVAE